MLDQLINMIYSLNDRYYHPSCNPSSGTPRNPYNLNHFTGGSSGGSAGAVGSGLVPIALGADGGGSIRIPASFCGVYGLKTTAHRINSQGSFPLGLTVGVVGPIAASAHDLAVAYAAMAGMFLGMNIK